LAAVVVAPVWEEVIFRGLLQRWFLARPWGGVIALVAALGLAVMRRGGTFVPALLTGGRPLLEEAVPFLALLAMLPVYLTLRGRAPRPLAEQPPPAGQPGLPPPAPTGGLETAPGWPAGPPTSGPDWGSGATATLF